MITIENRFFPLRTVACVIIEGSIIFISVLSSYIILGKLGNISGVDYGDVVLKGGLVAVFCQTCMYMLDLYDIRHARSLGELFFSLVFSIGVVCIGVGAISILFPMFGVGNEIYYMTIVFVAIFLMIW